MKIDELSSSLRTVVSALHKSLRKQAYSTKAYSMTEAETIGLINRETRLLPSQLASMTRVKTQSMSSILNKLEENGIIKRTPSKEDGRKIYISLTPAGKKLVENAMNEYDESMRNRIEKSLNEKEKELLIKAIPVLNKLLEIK